MKNRKFKITNDGFGIHTFELTRSGISRDEFERITNKAKNSYFSKDRRNVCIYPSRKGVRILINYVDSKMYNVKVIVSAKRLIDEDASSLSIMNLYDNFELLDELVNDSLLECLGKGYTFESMCLSRIDLCVNVMLSESFSAERYVKLIRRSMRYDNSAKIVIFPDDISDSVEKNRHSFRIKTGGVTFTAYDKYFQLEDINESFDKESAGFLRLELAVHREAIHSVQSSGEFDNSELLRFFTDSSEDFFKKYIENHFWAGDYYSLEYMRAAINLSDLKKKAKENMLFYADIQCQKHSFKAVCDCMFRLLGSKFKLNKVLSDFESIGVYPISLSYRDRHGDRSIPGLRKIFGI